MTTGRINQIAIHFPSPFLLSRRRSARVLEKERSPETRSPQAVQARLNDALVCVSLAFVGRLAGWTPSLMKSMKKTHTCNTLHAPSTSLAPISGSSCHGDMHGSYIHHFCLRTARLYTEWPVSERMRTAFAARSPPQGLATPAFGVWLLSRVLSVVRPVREV